MRKAFPRNLAQELVALDYKEELGIVGALGTSDTAPIIAAAHWILSVNENMAEVAFSVADEYQHRGIGTHLLRFLMRIAKERGIRGFRASVLAGNAAMMRVFQQSECRLHTEYDSGVISLSFQFDEQAES
jgi:GNAT superfamily N-acetyltransferase